MVAGAGFEPPKAYADGFTVLRPQRADLRLRDYRRGLRTDCLQLIAAGRRQSTAAGPRAHPSNRARSPAVIRARRPLSSGQSAITHRGAVAGDSITAVSTPVETDPFRPTLRGQFQPTLTGARLEGACMPHHKCLATRRLPPLALTPRWHRHWFLLKNAPVLVDDDPELDVRRGDC